MVTAEYGSHVFAYWKIKYVELAMNSSSFYVSLDVLTTITELL